MASASSLLSEEQFQCSICLDVFCQPVSIPCGHTFCKACITGFWDSSGLSQCPLCNERFTRRPKLRVNTAFREVVERFKKMNVTDRDETPAGPGDVTCDLCTGTKVKALKSCLVCLASYCESHLEPHQRAPALRRHALMAPVDNLEDRLCRKHHKSLELFCQNDQTCVCVLCLKDDHAAHETVSLEEECEKRKALLRKTQADLRQLLQSKSTRVQEIKRSMAQSKAVAEKEIADGVKVFNALLVSIERSQAELVGVIEEKQKVAETQAEDVLKALGQEIAELQGRSAELERLSHAEDPLHLLLSFPSLPASPPPPPPPTAATRDWWSQLSGLSAGAVSRAAAPLEESLSRDLERMIREVERNDGETETEEKQAETTPEARLRSVRRDHAVDVTLDPDSANPSVFLSWGGKKAEYGGLLWHMVIFLCDKPKVFNMTPSVLGKEGFSSGRFYYEVRVGGKTAWTVGVVLESIDRKALTPMSPQNGYWTVGLSDDEYVANDSLCPARLSMDRELEKVGVFVDYEAGEVSFYDVQAEALIYSYTGCSFSPTLLRALFNSLSGNFSGIKPKLFPFFNTGFDGVPLVITPIHRTR